MTVRSFRLFVVAVRGKRPVSRTYVLQVSILRIPWVSAIRKAPGQVYIFGHLSAVPRLPHPLIGHPIEILSPKGIARLHQTHNMSTIFFIPLDPLLVDAPLPTLLNPGPWEYTDRPSITSFDNQLTDAQGTLDDAASRSRLTMVGATRSMFRGKTARNTGRRSDYVRSDTHRFSDRYSGCCTQDHLVVPVRVFSTIVDNTLERLNPSEWKSIEANDGLGLGPFRAELKRSLESWANSRTQEDPIADPKTERSMNVRKHFGTRLLPSDAISLQPAWKWEGPPIEPSVTLVKKRGEAGPSAALDHIFVNLPCFAEYPANPYKGDDSPQIMLTGTQALCTDVVASMEELKPMIQSMVQSYTEGKDGVTEKTIRKAIGRLLEADLETRIKYNSKHSDYKRQVPTPLPLKRDSSRPSQNDATVPVKADSSWTLDSVPGKPFVRIKFRPGNGQKVPDSVLDTELALGSGCASAFKRTT
jgi:hypothetical protein